MAENGKGMATRVLLVSDRTWGGAAQACRRLWAGLNRRQDVRCTWLAAQGEPGAGAGVVDGWRSLPSLVAERLVMRWPGPSAQRERWLWRLACRRRERSMQRAARRAAPAVVNLHNLHEAFSFGLIERWPARVPMVWTLHDLWPLTGYCYYSYGCSKYATGCGAPCPQREQWGTALDQPDVEWRRREAFFRGNRDRIVFVSPSDWLAHVTRRRFGDVFRVQHIPNGLDLEVFRPRGPRREVRRLLGLPPDPRLVLFGADSLTDPRKGGVFLIDAVRLMRERLGTAFQVAAFGAWLDRQPFPEDWTHCGPIHDPLLLSLYYAAADVFVLPSLADNLPNTLLEAVASGTPCVAFRTGGCPEVVRDGKTGVLARAGEAADLAAAIERVLAMSAEQTAGLASECRRVAEAEYSQDLQAERYVKLFRDLAGSGG